MEFHSRVLLPLMIFVHPPLRARENPLLPQKIQAGYETHYLFLVGF